MSNEIIKTSETRWFERLTLAYKDRRDVVLVDDAHVGLDPGSQTLFQMARLGKISAREVSAVLVSLGVSGVGIGMLLFAWFDPEPTSKLSLLIVGGSVLALTGGLHAARLLTRVKPPSIRVSPRGIEIDWT